MRSNPVRRVMAVVIRTVLALLLGAAVTPVCLLIGLADPALARDVYAWGVRLVDRVNRVLDPPPRHEGTPQAER